MTGGLKKPIHEHREGRVAGFTARYRIHRTVHFESFSDAHAAINREKEIKAWRRPKKVALVKVALVEDANPNWDELAEAWFAPYPSEKQVPHP